MRKKILYIGQLNYGGTCLQRKLSLEGLGYTVRGLDVQTPKSIKIDKNILYRGLKKIFGPLDLSKINERIITAINTDLYDIVWIDKYLTIKSETIKYIKKNHIQRLLDIQLII